MKINGDKLLKTLLYINLDALVINIIIESVISNFNYCTVLYYYICIYIFYLNIYIMKKYIRIYTIHTQ